MDDRGRVWRAHPDRERLAGTDNRAITQDEYDQIAAVIEGFLLTRTLDELYEKAVQLRFRLAPAATAKDIVESRQIQARGLLVPVAHPELESTVLYPGPFARFSAAPIESFRRPPLLGEDNQAIFRELDSSDAGVALAGDGSHHGASSAVATCPCTGALAHTCAPAPTAASSPD